MDISPGENIIDSRDILARKEELADELESLEMALENAKQELEDFLKTNSPEVDQMYDADLLELENQVVAAQSAIAIWNTIEGIELEDLNGLIEDAESSPDWSYGETLIHENYFTTYTQDLVEDCYDMPKEFASGDWPWRHMEMNWEDAAAELKSDYMEVDFGGETYLIRA